jgi:hypothetical protein
MLFFGSRELRDELRQAARRLAAADRDPLTDSAPFRPAVEEAQRKIREERAYIANQVFCWNRTWSGSNWVANHSNDTASFTMTIDMGLGIAGRERGIVEEIALFPQRGITVSEVPSRSGNNLPTTIVLNVSGNVASIQDFRDNQSNYQVTVWFDNMRHRGNIPSTGNEGVGWGSSFDPNVRANVLKIAIVDTRNNRVGGVGTSAGTSGTQGVVHGGGSSTSSIGGNTGTGNTGMGQRPGGITVGPGGITGPRGNTISPGGVTVPGVGTFRFR